MSNTNPQLEAILSSVETSLVDITEAIEKLGGRDRLGPSIDAMTKAVANLRGLDLKPLVDAIKNMPRPEVTVNVPPAPPAPAPVVQFMEREDDKKGVGATFEVSLRRNGYPEAFMTIKRTV